MELRRDVAPEQPPEMVEEPPYRMVPGTDAVCTRTVLRRFHSMKIQPSRTQQRKPGKWERHQISGHTVSDVLLRKTGTHRVNASGSAGALKMSENTGHHITHLGPIREVHVRWHGDPHIELTTLNKWAEILRQSGFTVVLSEENNVDWPSTQSRTWVLNRRNRKFLRVAKFHHQKPQRDK